MSVLQNRILKSMNLATGTQQLTPDQEYFQQTNAVGRWATNYDIGTHAPAYVHRRYQDGTCDTVSTNCDNEFYSELGGQGARDIAVGRI